MSDENPYDGFADEQQAPATRPAPSTNPYKDVLSDMQVTQAQTLRTSLGQADAAEPDRAAEVDHYSRQTSLPYAVVDRNLEAIRKRVKLQQAPVPQMQRQTPALATWLQEPKNAAVAKDDYENLGLLDYLLTVPSRAFAQTMDQQNAANLRFDGMFRDLTPEEHDKLNAYDYGASKGGNIGGDTWWSIHKPIAGIGSFLANQVEAWKFGVAGAVEMAVAGGLAGSILPGVGTMAGAAAGASRGFVAGQLYGVVKSTFKQEAGGAYQEYQGFRDEHGQPIDPRVLKAAALAVGAINAPIEAGAQEVLLRKIPYVSSLTGGAVKATIKQALLVPTIRGALFDMVKSYGETLTAETGQEVAQRAVTIFAGELAKTASGQQVAYRSPSDVGQDLVNEGLQAASSFAFGILPGPAMTFAQGAARARQAAHNETFFTALGDATAASKTLQRAPQAVQDFVAHATKDGPISELYVDPEPFAAYWQSKGVDPHAMARELTGRADALSQAQGTGEPLAIPTSKYATTIAPTEHNAFFAQELRLGPDQMNGREAVAFQEEAKRQAEEPAAKPTSTEQVRTQVEDMLTRAGVPAETASSYATLYESAFGTLAERAGVDPADLMAQYGLQVQREGEAPLSAGGPAEQAAAAGEGAPAAAEPPGAGAPSEVSPTLARALDMAPPAVAQASGETVRAAINPDEPIAALREHTPQSIVAAARAMRAEDPRIEAKAAAMRASAAGRVKPSTRGMTAAEATIAAAEAERPARQPGVSSQAAHAAQQAARAAAGVAEPAASPAAPQAGEGLLGGAREQPGAHPGGIPEAAGHAPGAERGGLPPGFVGRPAELDEVFRRRPLAENQARLTPEIVRELERMQEELSTFPFLPRQWHGVDPVTGKPESITAGMAGAPVYDDVLYHAPVNEKTVKGQKVPADVARGTRAQVTAAIEKTLTTSDIANNLAEGAVRVAERRSIGDWKDLTPPWLPPSWGTEASPEMVAQLDRDIDRGLASSADLLADEFSVSDADLSADVGDTSFNIDEFDQSLFDDLAPAEGTTADQLTTTPSATQQADVLPTGEVQPRLPGAEGVREQDIATPQMEAPFALTPPTAAPRTRKQRELFQSAFHGSPHVFEQFSLQAIGSGEGNQSYGYGLYFASKREVAEGYRERLAGEATAAGEKAGRTYTVEIPEDDQMLDWDKPASQQPAQVQAALKTLGISWDPFVPKNAAEFLRWTDTKAFDRLWREDIGIREGLQKAIDFAERGDEAALANWQGQHQGYFAQATVDPTGEQIYDQLRQQASAEHRHLSFADTAKFASLQLAQAGLAGIRYLDGFSRDVGRGSYNYVVVDDRLVNIREFDQAGRALTNDDVQAWTSDLQQRVGPDLMAFDVALTQQGDLRLNMIAVDRGAQRAGVGTRVLQELTRFADLNGRRITLTPALRDPHWGTTSRSRLVDFYKRFGFVENRGRMADLSISDGMYREPTLPTPGGRELAQRVEEGSQHERSQEPPAGGPRPEQRRGAIRFGPGQQTTIRLFERADLSTFLHESGHLFLEVMGDLADRLMAAPIETLTDDQRSLLADWGKTLTSLGVERRDQIETAQHEQFARSFEAYLMEGQAPDVTLRSTFARFRAWLLGIYGALKNLKVDLSDEVRGVFDRMLASEQAIRAAEAQRGVAAMFTTAESAGMSAGEFSLYTKTIAEASATARQQLEAQLTREVQREREANWKARRTELRAEIERQTGEQPVYRAISAMLTGTEPDGRPLREGQALTPLTLSRQAIVEEFGADRIRRLPRGLTTQDGGLLPTTVARLFGYDSGDALLTAVEQAPPLKAVVEQETKRRMVQEFGSILLDGSLNDRAQGAVANEDRERVIRAELRALAQLRRTVAPFVQAERKAGAQALRAERGERAYERRWFEAEAKLKVAIAKGAKQTEIDALQAEVMNLRQKARGGPATIRAAIPQQSVIRATASERIASTRIRDLKPAVFWAAAQKTGAMAIEQAARQDFDGAIRSKQQQLLNLELYRQAQKAVEDIDARTRFARGLATGAARKNLGLAGANYLEQVDGILDRFEFVPVPITQLEKRASLRKFADGLAGEGFEVDIPDDVLDDARRVNYRELTVDGLVGVTDGLKAIVHLAQLKNRLLKVADQREFSAVRDGVVSSIREHNEARPRPLEFTAATDRWRTVGDWFASHTKLSQVLQSLDGYVDGGPLWSAIMAPLNLAADTEQQRFQAVAKDYGVILERFYPGRELGKLHEQLHIPAIGASLSKEARLAVALNWGNQTSRDRLLSDPQRRWNREQVQAILDTLDKRDWDYVQATWDYVNTFWPEIAAKQERVTGLAPEKVEALPVTTPFGDYAGGYYPLAYDSRLSVRAAQHEAAGQARLAAGAAYVRSTTKRGHVEARVAHASLSVRLELGVMFQHLEQVIHDLTHHETLIDVTRLIRDSSVSKAILETQGDLTYQQITRALQDIAIGSTPAARSVLDKSANFMRTGTQLAMLGFNLWTSLQQPLGIFNGAARVGPVWVARGLKRWLRDAATMENTARWIASVSPMMAERGNTATQDLHDLRARLREPGGWFDSLIRRVSADTVTQQTLTDAYLWHIAQAQRVADIPTWLGQYEKSMAGGETEARALGLADQAVLDAQGGGHVKDLAQIQRGGPVARLFMTFYSYGNTVFNATTRAVGQTKFRSPSSVLQMVGNLSLIYAMPALGTVALAHLFGRARPGDEPPDWFAEIGREMLAGALNTMVLVRELQGLVSEGARGYAGPAGARALEVFYKLGQEIKQGEVDAGFWRAANTVGGILFRYPAAQVQRTVDGWAALEEGRTANPAVLLTGPPPKHP